MTNFVRSSSKKKKRKKADVSLSLRVVQQQNQNVEIIEIIMHGNSVLSARAQRENSSLDKLYETLPNGALKRRHEARVGHVFSS